MKTQASLFAIAMLVVSCGSPPDAKVEPARPATTARPPASSAAPADPLGAKPEPALPAPFVPPSPVVYSAGGFLNVWLLERHTLPVVAVNLVVMRGAASDPEGKGGLAKATAGMLDEGAGKRGALDIARDIDLLGATLSTNAYADYSLVSLHSLKKNLPAAMAIFSDVIMRPTFPEKEWARTHALLLADLKAAEKDPEDVSEVVALRTLFGPKHPYGHPNDGTVQSASRFTLDDAKRFYSEAWRPDHSTLVVVGDITRAELDAMLATSLREWKPPRTPSPLQVAPLPDPVSKRRIVLVDRADAPQTVITLLRPGIRADEPDAALLGRANIPLGGSFTSRLNQDLREERGLTYGAKSRVSFARSRGMVAAEAAVFVDKTGEALRAMLSDVSDYAKSGPTEEEIVRSKLAARSDLVESFESVRAAAARLSRNAGVGLPVGYDGWLARARDKATGADLARVSSAYFDPKDAIIVIVGPKAKVLPQLEGLGAVEVVKAE